MEEKEDTSNTNTNNLIMSKEAEQASLENLLSLLSTPQDFIHTLLLPSTSSCNNEREEQLKTLQTTSKILFTKMELLAKLYYQLKSSSSSEEEEEGEEVDTAPLSGLDSLYVGEGEEEGISVDAETLWGQVELQNAAFMKLVSKSLKKLGKRVEKHQHGGERGEENEEDLIRLLSMDGLEDEEEKREEESDEESSDEEEEEEEEDEEAIRMQKRMEKAMAEMSDDNHDDNNSSSDAELGHDSDDSNSDSNDDDDDDDFSKKEQNKTINLDNLYDPVAEEMKDGFFDLNEMEAFADEEEEYLPDDAYGQEKDEEEEDHNNKKKKKKKMLPHEKLRNGQENNSDSEEEDDEEFNELTKKYKASTVRRRRYREDDEIDALYDLYQDAEDNDSEDEDEEEEAADMTAADFFGVHDETLRKRYYEEKKKGRRDGDIGGGEEEDDADSWDNQNFEEEGDDWRDTKDDEDDDGDKEEENDDNNEKDEEEEKAITKPNSNHSIQTQKLNAQTLQLEQELLAEKPWQMTGEAKATSRPLNSLLESSPEFEVATKMNPIITVEHTENLEDMIKKRIIAEDWDDVAPRELPDIGWNKKRGEAPEVSQEKSKLGLGELYEREYLKKATGYDPDAAEKQSEEDKAKGEMKMIFANLCSKLDALSNYHFTPRPMGDEDAEVRAVTVPAIAMEEVMPLHVSDARGVAPEEVYGKKRGRESVIRGESEMDQTDRKRLRNAKKAARRKARKEKLADEKLISRLQPGLGLNNPYEKRKMREELSMARASGKVAMGEIDADANFNTSAKFFQKMQENVQDEIRGVAGGAGGGKKKKGLDEEGVHKSSALKL